jgi:hypothetical protein
MDANGHESGIATNPSPEKTSTFAEASVGGRSSHGLSGTLRLARFDACSRLPATDLPSVSLIPSGRFKHDGSLIRVSVHEHGEYLGTTDITDCAHRAGEASSVKALFRVSSCDSRAIQPRH